MENDHHVRAIQNEKRHNKCLLDKNYGKPGIVQRAVIIYDIFMPGTNPTTLEQWATQVSFQLKIDYCVFSKPRLKIWERKTRHSSLRKQVQQYL